MSREQVAIFCAAGCVEGAMQRILIAPTDTVAICPTCKRSYGVVTRLLEGVDAKRLPDGRYRYLLQESESHGGRRLRKVETAQSLGLQPGSRISLVRRGPILVGLADHDREVWFSIEPAPSRIRGGKRFLDYMSAVILLCILLTSIGYLASLQDYITSRGVGAAILLTVIVILGGLIQFLAPRIHERMQSRGDGPRDGDRRGLPPLKLPDLD